MSELDQLAAQAAELDADAAAASGAPDPTASNEAEKPEPEAPELSTAKELAALLEGFRALARARKFKRTAESLDDESIAAISESLAPVLEKYGLKPSAFFGSWKLEITAALICGPLLWAVFVAMRADLEEHAAAAAKPVPPEPAADDVPQ
jgi:hypothetical protein